MEKITEHELTEQIRIAEHQENWVLVFLLLDLKQRRMVEKVDLEALRKRRLGVAEREVPVSG